MITLSTIAAEFGVTKRSVQDWHKKAKTDHGELGQMSKGIRVFTEKEKSILLEYSGLLQPKTVEVPEVDIEVGNHSITIAPPAIPTSFNLEQYRDPSITAIAIDDPMAFVSGLIQVTEQIQGVMNADIQRREAKVDALDEALEVLEKKLQDVKLEQRFYTERARNADLEATRKTEKLQRKAKDLTGK